MTPTRRRLLTRTSRIAGAGVLVGGTTGLAGCLDGNGDGEGTPDPTPEEPDPRVEDPPHDIEEPDPGSGEGDWDENYLCEGIDADPTVEFEEAVATGPTSLGEALGGLDYEDRGAGEEYFVELLGTPAEFEAVDDGLREELGTPDFDEEAVLVLQTGWGSSSVRPKPVRIEPVDGGIHAHGCHVVPFVQTDDVTVRTLVVRFDRPDDGLERATVSLTVAPDRRVALVAGEGVVSL
ncbi:hypothetical protein JCM17823_09340 [Halorubrum gandharaense]